MRWAWHMRVLGIFSQLLLSLAVGHGHGHDHGRSMQPGVGCRLDDMHAVYTFIWRGCFAGGAMRESEGNGWRECCGAAHLGGGTISSTCYHGASLGSPMRDRPPATSYGERRGPCP